VISIPKTDAPPVDRHLMACSIDKRREPNTLRIWILSGNWIWTGVIGPRETQIRDCMSRHLEGPATTKIHLCGWNRLHIESTMGKQRLHYLVDVSSGTIVTPWLGPYYDPNLREMLHIEPTLLFGLFAPEERAGAKPTVKRYDFRTRKHSTIHQCATTNETVVMFIT